MKSIQYISYSCSNDYRFGFNGKEKDKETYGEGNEYDYGFRIYDPRIGKFLSVDPLTKKYPELSPYQFAENQPIWAVDLDGLEKMVIHATPVDNVGGTKIDIQRADFVLYKVNITIDHPDGKVEQVEMKKPLVIFINKSLTRGIDKLKTGKSYSLAWQRMDKRWSTNENTIFIFGTKSFIHPVPTSGKVGHSGWLTGCKGIGFENDVKIGENKTDLFAKKEFTYSTDPNAPTKPIIPDDQRPAFLESSKSSNQAMKSLNETYQSNQSKLQEDDNFELKIEPVNNTNSGNSGNSGSTGNSSNQTN